MFGQFKGMQQKFIDLQNETKNMKFSAETGGGMVKAIVNGRGHLLDLSIDTSLLESDELSIIANLTKKAIQEAQSRSQSGTKEKMKELSGGLGKIPGLDQFFS